jgi:hypothetical protein
MGNGSGAHFGSTAPYLLAMGIWIAAWIQDQSSGSWSAAGGTPILASLREMGTWIEHRSWPEQTRMLTELIMQLVEGHLGVDVHEHRHWSSLLDEIDAYGVRLLILFGGDPQVLATAETAVMTHPELSYPRSGMRGTGRSTSWYRCAGGPESSRHGRGNRSGSEASSRSASE